MISIRRKILTVVAASILLATQPALAKMNRQPKKQSLVLVLSWGQSFTRLQRLCMQS